MKRLAYLLLAVLGGFVPLQAHAQEVCYRWYSNNPADGIVGQYFGTVSAAGEAAVAYRQAHPATGGTGVGQYTTNYVFESCVSTPPSGTAGSRQCTYSTQRQPVGSGACSGSGGTVNCTLFPGSTFSISYGVDPAGCPACEFDGMKNWGVSTSGKYPADGYCEGSCRVTPSQQTCSGPVGFQTCTAVLAYAEEASCSGGGTKPTVSDEDTPSGSEPEGEKCMDVGDGEYCAAPSGGGQCGYMNDSYICLKNVKQNECKPLADGGRVCGAGAVTTPPVPDSGTPGEVAEPDGVLENVPGEGSATNYNYYNSTTVAGSSRDPGTTGEAPDGGSPGSEDDDDGSGGLPSTCEGDDCTGELPELEEIGTLSEAFEGFWDDLQAVPLVAAAADIGPSFGTGACPDWSTSVDALGQAIEIDFTSICTLWSGIAGVLTMCSLVMWGFISYRVLMSA